MNNLIKTVLIATLSTCLSENSIAQGSNDSFFELSQQFFSQNVDESGNVDYMGLSENKSQLDKLSSVIANYKLDGMSSAQKKAFYTNTYNLLVIKQIVDRYPIKGPLAVNGFFDKIKNTVAGEELTLNQVEKDKNIYVNGDERLHFALVCGAKGCPPLANFAYTPEMIESQLEDRTRVALNSDYFIRPGKGKTKVSQIFSWYKDDFKVKDVKGIVGYLNKYRKNQIPDKSKIVYYEYDWNLNVQ